MRDHSRSSITSGSSTARRRKACRSVRSEQASTWASRLSSLAPATLKRSRKRSSCLGLMAKTLKPRSSSASTTGPRGVSIAAAISAGSAPVFSTSHVHSSDNSAPPCVTSRSATHLPSASSRQTRCCALAQSTPTNQRTWSLIPFTSNRLRAYRDLSSIPVLALEAQTSYWTSVAAVLPGHMSYGGARGTGGHWSLPADRPVASLQADWLPNVMKGTGWAKASRRRAVPTRNTRHQEDAWARRFAPLPTLRRTSRTGGRHDQKLPRPLCRPDRARQHRARRHAGKRPALFRRTAARGVRYRARRRAADGRARLRRAVDGRAPFSARGLRVPAEPDPARPVAGHPDQAAEVRLRLQRAADVASGPARRRLRHGRYRHRWACHHGGRPRLSHPRGGDVRRAAAGRRGQSRAVRRAAAAPPQMLQRAGVSPQRPLLRMPAAG